jgi:site-specific recombinase
MLMAIHGDSRAAAACPSWRVCRLWPTTCIHKQFMMSHQSPAGSVAAVEVLAARLGAARDLVALIDAWNDLVDWLAADDRHVGQLVEAADHRPTLRADVGGGIARLIVATDIRDLLATVGLPSRRGFLSELGSRLAGKVLPVPRQDRELHHHWRRWLGDGRIGARIGGLPPRTRHRLVAGLVGTLDAPSRRLVRAAAADALRLLAARIQAEGLSEDLRSRSHDRPIAESPFFRLSVSLLATADAWVGGSPGDVSVVRSAMADCRAEIAEVHRQIEDEGISVDLVYSLDVLGRCFDRLDLLTALGQAADEVRLASCLARLLGRLADEAAAERSVRHLVRGSLRLLHQRIVERSGRTGEHYIARDRAAYAHSWLAAAGGGILTTATAAGKLLLGGLHVAAAMHGVLYGLNYAASFILLQHLHLILATKQPAMTAAALAGIMRQARQDDRVDQLVDVTARIVHWQLAAAIANVTLVACGAFALDNLWQLATGHHVVDAAKAAQIYGSLSPVNSLTVLYAALTGVILWLSSLVGGWVDNFAALRRLPQALRESRLRGRPLTWLGDGVERHLAGWATNISLGMMLGFAPVIGEFLGLPIDVRHVTLSTGTLALACAGHDDWWNGGFFLLAVSGIAVMFVLNLGVSFGLSLFTALRAYELPRGELPALGAGLLRRLTTRPQDFLWPWPDRAGRAP